MSTLQLSGSSWALESSLATLRDVLTKKKKFRHFSFTDFDVDVTTAALFIQVLNINSPVVKSLSLNECTGHVELVVTAAMAMNQLEKFSVSVGRLAPAASTPVMHALGVGLQISSSLKELVIQSGSNVFFTLSPEAADSLEEALSSYHTTADTSASKLERFTLKSCRFGEPSAVRSVARGLKNCRSLRHVNLQSCYTNNGHPLDDFSLSKMIQSLEHITSLESLDISGNKCLDAGMDALANLIIRTKIRRLNVSNQIIEVDYDEKMNVSLLVRALARTDTLQTLELRFNKLCNEDMAYLVSGLSHNRSIHTLGLASNKIKNAGISILASKIAEMKGLKRIMLTNNQFDEKATSELANALHKSHNWTLESVECGPGKVNDAKLQHFTDCNWAGRQLLKPKEARYGRSSRLFAPCVAPGLWPLILERINKRLVEKMDSSHARKELKGVERGASVIYFFLREGPVVLER